MKKILMLMLLLANTAANAAPYIPIDVMLEDEVKAMIAKTRAEGRHLGARGLEGQLTGGTVSKDNCSVDIGNYKNDGRAGRIQPREINVVVLGNVVNSSDCKK